MTVRPERSEPTVSPPVWQIPLSLAHDAWEKLRRSDWVTRLFLLTIVCWIVGVTALVFLRYQAHESYAFDLGVFNQAFTTALQGRLFYETPDMAVISSGSFLGTHFNLLMFLLLPFYAIAPAPETLLVMQSLVLGLAAVPVWLLAVRILGDKKLALLLSLAYLFNPGTLSLAIYDFHLEAFLPLFLGLAFYTFWVRRWRLHVVFLILSMVSIEFAPLLVFGMALVHLLSNFRLRREGLPWWRSFSLDLDRTGRWILFATLVASPIVFRVMVWASFRLAGPPVGGTPVSSVTLLSWGLARARYVTQWIQFWLVLFGCLLFLPLLSPRALIMVLPWLLLTLMVVPITLVMVGYQYAGAFVAPFLIWATVLGLRRIRKPALARSLVVAAVVVSIALSPLNPLSHSVLTGIAYERPLPSVTPHDAIIDQAVALIPRDASVLAQNSLFPQVSGRADAYVYLSNASTGVDYVLADMTSWTYGQQIWGTRPMSTLIPALMASGEYGAVVYDDGVILLERGYRGALTIQPPAAVYDHRTLSLYSGGKVEDPSSQSGLVLVHNLTALSGVSFWYGPYVPMAPGTYRVEYRMKIGAGAQGGLILDAGFMFNLTAGLELARRFVNASDFPGPGTWTNFTLTFSLGPENGFSRLMEFRGIAVRQGPFYLDNISVTYLGAPQGV